MPNTIRPVHPLRIVKYFEEQHLTEQLRSDTTVEVKVANVVLTCDVSNPDLLRISATWDGAAASAQDIQKLSKIAHRCNAARFTPKAYTVRGKIPGTYSLGAEACIPIMSGLSGAQFYSFLETSITAIVGLFAEVDLELLPAFPEDGDIAKITPPSSRWRPGFNSGNVLTVVRGGADDG